MQTMADRDGVIWFDGEMVNWRDAKIHVLTHTLHYGVGIFEGMASPGRQSLFGFLPGNQLRGNASKDQRVNRQSLPADRYGISGGDQPCPDDFPELAQTPSQLATGVRCIAPEKLTEILAPARAGSQHEIRKQGAGLARCHKRSKRAVLHHLDAAEKANL